MVKRLRHRPFTAVTRVRVSVGSPGKTALNGRFFVCSGGLAQLVRASALQAGGRWFKSDSLHHRSRKASFAALRRSLRSVCVCACVCSSARKVPFRSSARGLCVPPRVRSRSLARTLLAGRFGFDVAALRAGFALRRRAGKVFLAVRARVMYYYYRKADLMLIKRLFQEVEK